jgi:type II secretory pathway pseudopilin PulG
MDEHNLADEYVQDFVLSHLDAEQAAQAAQAAQAHAQQQLQLQQQQQQQQQSQQQSVKREDPTPPNTTAKLWTHPPASSTEGNANTTPSIPPLRIKSIAAGPGVWYHSDERKIHPSSPPAIDTYPHPPTHGQPVIISPAVNGAPSTPPETPPVGSPTLTQNYPYHYQHRQSGSLCDDMMFLPHAISRGDQPLDLRPIYSHEEWERKDGINGQLPFITTNGLNGNPPSSYALQHGYITQLDHNALNIHHHQQSLHAHPHLHSSSGGSAANSSTGANCNGPSSHRPHSVGSASTMSPRLPHHHNSTLHHHHHSHHSGGGRGESASSTSSSGSSYHGPCTRSADDLINDELLMSLTVRELNKRLHGYPREDVVRLKQKRRTLKNRGYAQNCRSKRLQQRHDLEITNRNLHVELKKMQMDLARISQERDQLKQRLTQTGSGGGSVTQNNGRNGQQDLHSDGHSSPEFYL